MTIQPEGRPDAEWTRIRLKNHPRDEYSDILEHLAGRFPVAYTYLLQSQMDMDADGEVESRDVEAEGIWAEAWIDLSGSYAVVMLNPNNYADMPADELTEEAERILLEWEEACRRELGLEDDEPEPPAG